jgi:DNA-binding MarR family transcriptional regulator
LKGEPSGLGRGHWRAAVLMKRRPGLGVQALARLTGPVQAGGEPDLSDLERAGYATRHAGEEDARRRPAVLTEAGRAFEARASERARAHLAGAYRAAGLDAVTAARRVLAAMAGRRRRP